MENPRLAVDDDIQVEAAMAISKINSHFPRLSSTNYILNKILHKLFTKTTEYGKSFVDTYQRDKSYKNIGIYMFFKSMRS